MAIGVLGIGFTVGMFRGKQDKEVRSQVRQGMHTIGDQCLGTGGHPDNNLDDAQQQVKDGANQCHLAHFLVARIHRVGQVGMSHDPASPGRQYKL